MILFITALILALGFPMPTQLPAMPEEYVDELLHGYTEGVPLVDKGVRKGIIPGSFSMSKDAVPHEVVEAVIARESEWKPNAYNDDPCWSGGHAEGLGQFCSGPNGEPGGGSMEIADYEAITNQDITSEDIYNPKKAIELVVFGLNDRYARYRKTNPDDKNWYKAASGYSPIPDTPGESAYLGDLYDYVATYYGSERANEISQGKGAPGLPQGGKDCGDVPWWNVPERVTCTAGLLIATGQTATQLDKSNLLTDAIGLSKGFLIYAIAGAAVIAGFIMLTKGVRGQAVDMIV